MKDDEKYYQGCVGCITYNAYSRCCDFLDHHGRARPAPCSRKGCALKAATYSRQKALWQAYIEKTGQIQMLLKEGKSVEEIARELDVTGNTVSAISVGNVPEDPDGQALQPGIKWSSKGLTARRTGEQQPDKRKKVGDWKREEEFRALYDEGLTDSQIAERMGLKTLTIRTYRARRGWPVNKDKGAGGAAAQREVGTGTDEEDGTGNPEEKRREEPPGSEREVTTLPDEKEAVLGLEALVGLLKTAADGFECEKVLLGPDGKALHGCNVNLHYGADGKAGRVVVQLI